MLRRRVQQDTCGHRGRCGDPLFTTRLTRHTGAGLLTDKQAQRLEELFTEDARIEVKATWGVYQRMITAYREPDRAIAKEMMRAVIASISAGVSGAVKEVITLGWTLQPARR